MRYIHTEEQQHLQTVYPYFFSPAYAASVNSNTEKAELIYHEKLDAYIAVQFTKIRFLKRAGILTPPLRNGHRLLPAEETVFFYELLEFLKGAGVHRVIPQMPSEVFTVYPEKSVFVETGSYEIDLLKTEEDLFNRLRPNFRKSIRQAIDEDVQVVFGERVYEDCIRLVNQTHTRQGQAILDGKLVENFKKNMHQHFMFAVAYYKELPYGSVIIPYSTYAGYYLYGGSAPEQPVSGILKLLHWKVMLELKQQGVKKYLQGCFRTRNIKGTKFEGIQQFKQGFGPDLKYGFLWKTDISAVKGKLFDSALELKMKLSGQKNVKDIIDSQLE